MIEQLTGNISPATLFFVVLFFALINSGLYIVSDKWGIIDAYEVHKKRWMPCPGFCAFFWISLIELGPYLFRYPPFDIMNLIFIIGLALCAAVFSRYLIS